MAWCWSLHTFDHTDGRERTCLKVPQVLAAHLVVPGLPVAVPAAPHVQPGVDGHAAVPRPRPRDVLLQAVHHHCLPAHRVCSETGGQTGGGRQVDRQVRSERWEKDRWKQTGGQTGKQVTLNPEPPDRDVKKAVSKNKNCKKGQRCSSWGLGTCGVLSNMRNR